MLKSSQGEIFEVEPEVACMSTLVRTVGGKSGNFDVPMSSLGVLLRAWSAGLPRQMLSCPLARNMVDDSGTDEEIPLPNVKTAILSKVIDYCKYHKDSPPEEIQKPLKSTNLVPEQKSSR